MTNVDSHDVARHLRAHESLVSSLPAVRAAVDHCLPEGYECHVVSSLSLDAPAGITITVYRWPDGASVLSRAKLVAERRCVMLGLPPPTSCQLPLSEEAASLLRVIGDAVAEVLRGVPGADGVVCETRFDDRRLRGERTLLMQQLKTTSHQQKERS